MLKWRSLAYAALKLALCNTLKKQVFFQTENKDTFTFNKSVKKKIPVLTDCV